ncbi:flagellar biosynthesis protein FliR [Paenibacillus swuensis]|uniref:Flagellar biosynthetic protein FliR n=1 Tax=Paenibacillus swuensis TaxID=1178515 RepID=A0A172TKH8_9BACL|nr:flagellar biosynthetic protein FliR [Paenibacillus swuensis]ANE47551.1 flagellar biosynthesis protein FliR [Paenibacillus swuensis]
MELLAQYFPVFLLIFCRITSFFVVAPLFSMQNVPNQLKIGLSFYVSLLILMTFKDSVTVATDGTFVLSILREILAGLLLGFIAYLFFTIVQVAGSFIDLQMGFGIANVIDPMTGAQSPILGNFKFMISVLVFLSVNGHLYLLDAIMRSYEWVPLSNPLFQQMYGGHITDFLVRTFSETFKIAFQMSAPIVVAMFLTDLALGLLARTVPQLNIFVVGVPLKIIVGFLVMLLLIPGFIGLFEQIFNSMMEALHALMQLMGRQQAP